MANTFVVKLPAVGNATIEPFNEKDSYKQLSEAVGGCIESALIPTPLVEMPDCEIDCFVNEEGLLEGLPINQRLTALCAKSYGDLLVGDAIFVGHNGEGETVGLPKAVAQAILYIFMTQETQDPILSMERFAIVVTDKDGNRFVRTSGNGHPSAMICTPTLGDDICREVAMFHSREIAECYRKDTIDLVRTVYMKTARPPFKAEVVPVAFKIG